jgi:hypothetical protein
MVAYDAQNNTNVQYERGQGAGFRYPAEKYNSFSPQKQNNE